MTFQDRREAGRLLAERLALLAEDHPIVLGLPRGGVPVAAEVAHALHAPLDVILARKIGAPSQPELAIGAVAEGGTVYIDQPLCRALSVSAADVERLAQRELETVAAAMTRYRGGRPLPDLLNRTVILVDDGLATGATVRAAVRALLPLRPRYLAVAVPVAAAQSAHALRREVDAVIALDEPINLHAIGQWYEDFSPVDDEEVLALLAGASDRPVEVHAGGETLLGTLALPAGARGLVLFAHGSGSGRKSPRNHAVADALNRAGLATLRLDLLSEREQQLDAETGDLRFDVSLLASRLAAAIDWTLQQAQLTHLPLGLFGGSTGAAAALMAAVLRPDRVLAVVSRGGRVDLADGALERVRAPTLLVVGSLDHAVLALNERAQAQLQCPTQLAIIDGAGHLFEEPGTLSLLAEMSRRWYTRYLMPTRSELRAS